MHYLDFILKKSDQPIAIIRKQVRIVFGSRETGQPLIFAQRNFLKFLLYKELEIRYINQVT